MTWVSCCENLLKSDLGGRIFDSIKSDWSSDGDGDSMVVVGRRYGGGGVSVRIGLWASVILLSGLGLKLGLRHRATAGL